MPNVDHPVLPPSPVLNEAPLILTPNTEFLLHNFDSTYYITGGSNDILSINNGNDLVANFTAEGDLILHQSDGKMISILKLVESHNKLEERIRKLEQFILLTDRFTDLDI